MVYRFMLSTRNQKVMGLNPTQCTNNAHKQGILSTVVSLDPDEGNGYQAEI